MWVSRLISTLVVIYAALVLLYQWLKPKRIHGFRPQGLLVVITGCDSGFGRMSALHLTKLGYTVLAGCYTADGVKQMIDSGVAFAQQCDVTSAEDVTRLAAKTQAILAEADTNGTSLKLWSVINNAGIAPAGFVDWISMKSMRAVMEVNYFAVVMVVQAFLPLLKTTKNSRILNLSSAAGWAGFHGGAGYCASKHAVEGFAKCLRQELFGWNIHVCNINPGFMKTAIVATAEAAAFKEFKEASTTITSQYPESNMTDLISQIHALEEDPMIVVQSIESLLEADRPFLLNPSGWQANALRWIQFVVPHGYYCYIERIMNDLSKKGPYPEAVKRIQVK